jgi:ArsR family transcriptional regulator
MMALLDEGLTVADLGCGTGQALAALAPHVRRVIGVDNSVAMLKAAKKRIQGVQNVELRRGDLADLPIDSGTCDAAMLTLALTYVADPAAVLTEMARILKPGGRAAIIDLLPHDREEFRRHMGQTRLGFEARELEQLAVEGGLTSVKLSPLAPAVGVRGPALFLATARRPPAR